MKGLAVFCVCTQWQWSKGIAEAAEEPYLYNKLNLGMVLELLMGYRQ